MPMTFHHAKRDWTVKERGLDFADAERVFGGPAGFGGLTFSFRDNPFDYGEELVITFGLIERLLVVVCWTQRATDQHVFSMRKADDREQRRYGPLLTRGM